MSDDVARIVMATAAIVVGGVFLILGGLTFDLVITQQAKVYAVSSPSLPPAPPTMPPSPAPPPSTPPTHCGDWETYSSGGGAFVAVDYPCETLCSGLEGQYPTTYTAPNTCYTCRFNCCCGYCYDHSTSTWDTSFDLSGVLGCDGLTCTDLKSSGNTCQSTR